jgi:pimeloyl-ACP methyl ester carboxylesterase
MMAPLLDRIADKRDIIFLDQRGTGRADKPASLACELESGEVADFFDTEFPAGELRHCLEAYKLDTRHFTTENSVADLEAARKHFGHERIHLYGASYGTRLALSYLRRHPEPVVTAVLDGVAPPSISLLSSMDRGAHEMLERTFDDCEASPDCREAFPRLRERFDDWRSGHGEVGAQLAAEHPRTGARESVEVKTDAVMGVLRSAIYTPQVAALIPLALERLMAGDADPLVGLAGMGESMGSSISLGLFVSIVCAEDMRHLDSAELEWARSNTRFGTRMHDEISRLCAFWPVGEVPSDHAEPVRADTPTLLLSGALDPATPPRWGEMAAKTLAHAHHIVVPGVGHNTSMTGCVPELIEGFVESAGLGPIERGCVEGRKRPPFFLSEAGPAVGGKAQ